MTIKISFAGATGWAGSALARAIAKTEDLEIVSAVSRTHAGKNLGDVLQEPRLNAPIYATTKEALEHPCDVFIEYSKPEVAKENILMALEKGAHVVVGTSGLTDADYDEIDAAAQKAGRGVLAGGNFALTFALLQKFAEMAAKYVASWEIFDLAPSGKKDAPSGASRELAYRLSKVREAQLKVPLDEVQGEVAARGASIKGSQIHSVRLDGKGYETEITFGMPDQTLVMHHRGGGDGTIYADGAVLAIRKVNSFVGLRRGLDHVLDL